MYVLAENKLSLSFHSWFLFLAKSEKSWGWSPSPETSSPHFLLRQPGKANQQWKRWVPSCLWNVLPRTQNVGIYLKMWQVFFLNLIPLFFKFVFSDTHTRCGSAAAEGFGRRGASHRTHSNTKQTADLHTGPTNANRFTADTENCRNPKLKHFRACTQGQTSPSSSHI